MPNHTGENPLLRIQFRIPFDRIEASDVRPAADRLLAEARGRMEAIAGEPAPRTFDNTMHALDRMTEPLDYAMGVVRHLESVATYPELRAALQRRAAGGQRVLFRDSAECGLVAAHQDSMPRPPKARGLARRAAALPP